GTKNPWSLAGSAPEGATSPVASSGRAEPGSESDSVTREPSFGESGARTNSLSAPMRLVVACMVMPPPENRIGTTSGMVEDRRVEDMIGAITVTQESHRAAAFQRGARSTGSHRGAHPPRP